MASVKNKDIRATQAELVEGEKFSNNN